MCSEELTETKSQPLVDKPAKFGYHESPSSHPAVHAADRRPPPEILMAIKKSQLYRSLWDAADALRGGMDASQYKDYVLVLLFVKYVSDRYAGDPNAPLTVPEGGSFDDLVALKGNSEIGDRMNKVVRKLAQENDLLGAISIADFNDQQKLGKGKEMVDRLSGLIAIFQDSALDFSKNRADGDDLLGDAYEYFMRNFATESGKSKGQFYTPAEVSRIMAKLIDIHEANTAGYTLYDPTCGSGSLLIKAADEAPGKITIYGQEKDNATAGLARMNMYLHDQPAAEIWQDNTLTTPHWTESNGNLKRHDFAVANPPFSDKKWRTGFDPENDTFHRFAFGIPPAKNGDLAYFQHFVASLKSTGRGAIIMPHGVLFRGNTEGDIREKVIRQGIIKGIIGLPPNLFFGTGIAACIIVIDKRNAAHRRSIFFIDASRGFVKDGNKNRLRHQDIHKIVDIFTNQTELSGYSRLVPFTEIEANGFNLNIPRYIDSSDPEDLHDIEAHLRGGIPERDVDDLRLWWQQFPALRTTLFAAGPRAGYCQLALQSSDIRQAIAEDAGFASWQEDARAHFNGWLGAQEPSLYAIAVGDSPRQLVQGLSESLLQAFSGTPMLDPYDLYQRLMIYWDETMQDDLYLIVVDGWQKAARLRKLVQVSDDKNKEKPDLEIGKQKYKADLIPVPLVVNCYFAAEQKRIDALAIEIEELQSRLAEMAEEHGGEEGDLAAVIDEGKIKKKAVEDRIKEIKAERKAGVPEAENAEELARLEEWLELEKLRAEKAKRHRELESLLFAAIFEKYASLSEDEVKTLVIHDKWETTLRMALDEELNRRSQALNARVQQLADRYATPLPALIAEADVLAAKVTAHIERMGFAWN